MYLIILTQNDSALQFTCDNIALIKATVDNKLLLTLHCKEMMA